MTRLETLLKSQYDQEIIKYGLSLSDFETERDKFVYLAYKELEKGSILKEEAVLVNNEYFREAANNCETVYDMTLYVIRKLTSIPEENEEKVSVNIHNLYEDIVKGYANTIPFLHPDKYDMENDKFLDLDLFLTKGEIKYYNLDDYYEMDEEDEKVFFYLLPNGALVEKDNLDVRDVYPKSFLFVYPKSVSYETIRVKMNEYVRKYTNGEF